MKPWEDAAIADRAPLSALQPRFPSKLNDLSVAHSLA